MSLKAKGADLGGCVERWQKSQILPDMGLEKETVHHHLPTIAWTSCSFPSAELRTEAPNTKPQCWWLDFCPPSDPHLGLRFLFSQWHWPSTRETWNFSRSSLFTNCVDSGQVSQLPETIMVTAGDNSIDESLHPTSCPGKGHSSILLTFSWRASRGEGLRHFLILKQFIQHMQVREERRREIVMRGEKGEEMEKGSKKKREFSTSIPRVRVENFFYRGPDDRYFELCRSYGLLL